MKRYILIYITSYFAMGGLGFTILPDLTLKLFFSSGNYVTEIVQMAGMFMLLLASVVGGIVFYKDYKYFKIITVVRTFTVPFLSYLYFSSKDPMFLIIAGIVLVGLVPSYLIMIKNNFQSSKNANI